jgi:transcriptional regulator with GAF, ATPase, and Fis domain
MMSSVPLLAESADAGSKEREGAVSCFGEDPALEQIAGHSAALRSVLHQVETVARTDSTVLICGETGTGKELVARAIHEQSGRSGPFIKLNCAAIPPNLLESELFGHERGAFTGAVTRRTGRFELARNGTLFLDEIGEMAPELQPKLLRLLQEREFERVGSSVTLRSNARLLAATNRDLSAMVDEQTFREDLYYRLNVFPIHVPALRERRGDVPLLAQAFLSRFARRMNKDIRGISPSAMSLLESHHWPGNIRELQNVIERAVILTTGSVLEILWFDRVRLGKAAQGSPAAPPAPASSPPPPPQGLVDSLREMERAHILSVLQRTNWVIAGPNGAAARLGMKRSTLNFRMKRLGIARHDAAGTPGLGQALGCAHAWDTEKV